ncbi:hypothetical protein HPP92_009410 [Vanilla planifolia]|uniref:Small RNA 2'-O-methyltransferase n=1 Tax=Vanilla planifolia TaxID=51239 RepID=A0A835R468_VANPL|nr:hypothetical protein HPP92_009410 [Vanilla planifolia]
MLETEEISKVAMEQPALAPKAFIHQKFGSKALYRIEEIKQPIETSCSGLPFAQNVQCLYICHLDLPELSVRSDPFPRKKDAEHAAAKMAIEKLGLQSKPNNLTPQEALGELVGRLNGFFTDEFLFSIHPLAGHIKVALRRADDHVGMIPISIVAGCDVKVNNLCKVLNPKAASDPLLVVSLIIRAAQMSTAILICNERWICKQGSYPAGFSQSVKNLAVVSAENMHVKALFIPLSCDKVVETLTLNFSESQYYMEEIARKLHSADSSHIVVSRTVGKAASEMRLYFSAPGVPDRTSDNVERNVNLDMSLNERASYLCGQNVYGDAIMANIGYTWKSTDLFYEDISLSSYYRLILGKLPDGNYKLSRGAILAAELPTMYTIRSNWRGPTPRELLCAFCRQHQLAEPLFSIKSLDGAEIAREHCEFKIMSKSERPYIDVKVNGSKSDLHRIEFDRATSTFRCEVKIISKKRFPLVLIKCSFDDTHRKESDAVQSAALKVLSWLNMYSRQPDIPMESLLEFAHADNIIVSSKDLLSELSTCSSAYDTKMRKNFSLVSSCTARHRAVCDKGMVLCKIDGPDSGIFATPGSVASISYAVVLMKADSSLKEVLESNDEFEFEMGVGAVINELESCVSQLTVNQSAQFIVELPSRDLILSAAGPSAKFISQSSLHDCFLEFSVKLLQVMDPLEDRIEQALFSPPLSKQRLEFAVERINELHATSLVDFGCGSGCLLDSLLDHTTTLEKIAGVDISRKSLMRAAKVLHLKLSTTPIRKSIRSAVLYDGSITNFDSRLHEFDIATCLEVIEHMEEDQACLFGDIVLSLFCPIVLIVSTPNYEYNPILQRSSVLPSREYSEDKAASVRFRNHDHKFEWTREQFQLWANNLAERHHYSVEFSGVGGSGDMEPGFASQIAVFKRASNQLEKPYLGTEIPYEVIWEWNNGSIYNC